MIYVNNCLFMERRNLSVDRRWIEGKHSVHWHHFYEIEYVISGSGNYMINGQNFPAEEGLLYFMTPIDFHQANTDRTEIFNVMFSGNLVSYDKLAPFTSHNVPKAILVPADMRGFVFGLLEELVQYQQDEKYSSLLLECLLMKLSGGIMKMEKESYTNTARKMQFYIINHFREKVSLEEAAAYAGLTPTYASALFKKEMGVNFKQYLNDLRFSYAKKLLIGSEMSVTQICGECGFEDYPNFIRRFKAHFGVTPSGMRNG